jgi:cholesterol transport system auxiliary component
MTRRFDRRLAAGLSALALLAAPGCISVLPQTEPDTLYRLAASDLGGAGPAEGAATVIVGRLSAPRGLAGARIAIQRGDQIAYMAGAAWLSPAPDLLHAGIIDAFHASAPAVNAAEASDGVDARFELDLQLRHFEAVYDRGEGAAPLTRVGYRARLIDRDSRALVGARLIAADVRAAAHRQSEIVAAFSRASADAAGQLAEWTEGEICSIEDAPEACG